MTSPSGSRRRIIAQEKLASVEGLHRLALNPQKQFAAKDLVLKSVDIELRVEDEVHEAESLRAANRGTLLD